MAINEGIINIIIDINMGINIYIMNINIWDTKSPIGISIIKDVKDINNNIVASSGPTNIRDCPGLSTTGSIIS